MLGKITVVRKHGPKPAGRDVYIGRPSPLGNPFAIDIDGTREEVVAKYKVWLNQQIAHVASDDPRRPINDILDTLVNAHRDGEDINLVCWCSPKQCHGDVVKAFIESQS